jgi:hypothetical protein
MAESVAWPQAAKLSGVAERPLRPCLKRGKEAALTEPRGAYLLAMREVERIAAAARPEAVPGAAGPEWPG